MENQFWIFNRVQFRIVNTEVLENGVIGTVRVLQKKIDSKWHTELIEVVPLEVSNNLLRFNKWKSEIDEKAKKKFGMPVKKIASKAA